MQRTKDLLNHVPDPEDLDKDQLNQAICMDASEALIADLVSIWIVNIFDLVSTNRRIHQRHSKRRGMYPLRFNKELSQISCLCCYDALAESSNSGQTLKRSDFPSYFEYIVEDNIVCAPNARTHFATKELTEKYCEPMGVQSLLDFILHENVSPTGIICCENRNKLRDWS